MYDFQFLEIQNKSNHCNVYLEKRSWYAFLWKSDLEIIYISLSEKWNWHAKSHADEKREFKLDSVYFDLSPTVITALDLNPNAKNLIDVFFRRFHFYMDLIEVWNFIKFNTLRRNLELSGNLWLRFLEFRDLDHVIWDFRISEVF